MDVMIEMVVVVMVMLRGEVERCLRRSVGGRSGQERGRDPCTVLLERIELFPMFPLLLFLHNDNIIIKLSMATT